MDHLRPRILFFTGTDTDVGKTYVAALAVKELTQSGRRVGVYKPVASGCVVQGSELVSSDAINLWEASGQIHPLHDVCPQRFIAPLAPQSAAKLEGKQVDESLLLRGIDAVAQGVDMIVAEGAGGLMSPLSENLLNSDLARRLDAHVVIVAANRLGAIHQVLAAVTAASALRLPVVGIVLNQTSETNDLAVNDNAATIARFTQVPILGQLAYGAALTDIDWTSLPPPREVSTQIGKAWL
jgi:dethiobiotin synthetase